jgi:hypothetical protein
MMKNLYLLIIAGMFPLLLSAQLGSIKGKLIDSNSHQLLSEATVAVVIKKDSSLFGYVLSDTKGVFEIKNIPVGNYDIYVSFTGYQVFQRSFLISNDKQTIDLGSINLQPEYKSLTSVIVSDASPVRMTGDTISFRANAFNAKPGATVEDVLKKIPGIQVQKDGTVKAMGEQVQKVYVDGKEFFGNDPKVATKNLTADMVDQIQVFDDMSEQSRFTKIDDGSKTKSINIKLKKDRRKGDFGRAGLGLGSDSRYEGNLSFNRFRGNKRISVVGSTNNTNKQNYNFSDYSSQGNSSQFNNGSTSASSGIINPSGVTSGGISKPFSAGINYNDTWNAKIDFRASYFYSNNSNILEQDKFRRNTFPGDSASETITHSSILNNNESHRINARWEYAIDSMNSLLYTANFSAQQNEGAIADTSITMSDGVIKYLAAKTTTNKTERRKGINYAGELLYRRKFKRVGRTFTLGWRNTMGDNKLKGYNRSPVTTYDNNGNVTSELNIDQRNVQKSEFDNNNLSASYTEPIGHNKLLEINYAFSTSNNLSDKKTYDFDTASKFYNLLNTQQTNFFEYQNNSNRVGINFRQQFKKVNYQLGLGMQRSSSESRSIAASNGRDTTIRQTFINFFPTANMNFTISRSKSIRIYYRGRTNAPSVSQLQDVPDVTNPLVIRIGNPSLQQEFVNNVNISYNSFATLSQRFLSASFNFNYTGNKIVNSIDSFGAATIIYRPENMDGSFTSSGMTSLTFPVKKIEGLNINITNMIYLSRDANLVFKRKNFTTLFQMNQTAGVNYGKENFDFSLSGGLVYNVAAYNFKSGGNTKYFNHAYSADFTYRFNNRMFLLTDFDYYISSGRTAGFNQDIFLWNLSVAKKFFTTNVAEVKFTVYDLLKQNNGVSRNIGENYFEDVRTNVVPRFFLVSISYNLNRFVSQQEKKTIGGNDK